MPLRSLHVKTPVATFFHLMAAQSETFSTTLPLTELQSPIVPNKTNLIDPVYKNLSATVKAPFPRFILFIYSLCLPTLESEALHEAPGN